LVRWVSGRKSCLPDCVVNESPRSRRGRSRHGEIVRDETAVARLLEQGIAPALILPVTFTRVAAEDLHRELVSMDVAGSDGLTGVTLHSLAMSMLMRNHVLGATGRVPRPLNDFELEPLICDLMGAHGGKKAVKKFKQAYEAAWARLQHEQPGYVNRTY
jgi:DNA helicase-2/ATP-dependent DNA helicase PcrA